ncbi:MAG TPA: DUF2637 domain-containing protein [Streptosporangiaceae bacterium]|nr:DUF2637 domain-containing protein [Streptosporangiaceae bacterium]
MSVQTLSTGEVPDEAGAFGASSANMAPSALRIIAFAAVCLGVAALAAATFVLSYSAIRAVALQAGITPGLARGYPLLLDGMLVIVLAAVLALRGAGLPSRLLAWVTLLVVLAVAAGADALHTAGRSMPHQAAAITAAVLPFVLVLVAFALLLVMLRHARLRPPADAADRVSVYRSRWAPAPSAEPQPAEPQPTEPQPAEPQPAAQPLLAMDADPAAADPASGDPGRDEAVSEPATGTTPYSADALAAGWYDEADQTLEGDGAEYDDADVLTREVAAEAEPDDDDGPVFHRLFSAPIPPADDIAAEVPERDSDQPDQPDQPD